MSSNFKLNLLADFLKVVRAAIEDPSDKAAAKIAIDGITAWEDIATRPSILQLEADVGAYLESLPKAAPAAPAPEPDAPSSEQPSAMQQDIGDHAHGDRMDPSL